MTRSPFNFLRSGWVVGGCVVGSLTLLSWVFCTSGIHSLFRGPLPTDPQHLQGQTLELSGEDGLHPGQVLALADFRGQPVLVCRLEMRYTVWLLGALKRWCASGPKILLLAVSTAGDEGPASWVLQSGLPFHCVKVDAETMQRWGFITGRAELRLIDDTGKIATSNLADGDRDETILNLTAAVTATGLVP